MCSSDLHKCPTYYWRGLRRGGCLGYGAAGEVMRDVVAVMPKARAHGCGEDEGDAEDGKRGVFVVHGVSGSGGEDVAEMPVAEVEGGYQGEQDEGADEVVHGGYFSWLTVRAKSVVCQ